MVRYTPQAAMGAADVEGRWEAVRGSSPGIMTTEAPDSRVSIRRSIRGVTGSEATSAYAEVPEVCLSGNTY